MNQLDTNQLTQGLNQDIHPKFQEDGTYRFALNSILETREGDYGTISNEIGNQICAELPYATRIIGHALTENEEIVLFLFHRSVFAPVHEIGIYNPINCTYTTIGKSASLNFSDQHQINAFVRIRNGCERVVYFTDNYNPYRVANLTDTSDWVTPNTTNIPDVTKILYSREYTHPDIALGTRVDSGGSLEIGTYNFSTRLVDAEGNSTNWLEITRPVAIANEAYANLPKTGSYFQYDGGSNVSSDIGYVPKTNKSIILNYSDLDTRFKYFQVAVIKRTSMEGAITGVDILTPQPITGNTASFVYTGYDSQIETQTSIDEILSEKVVVKNVKAHATLDSRLYIANVTNTARDYTGFQRHASRIKVEYVKVDADSVTNKAKFPEYYFSEASFMSDEIYALGIVYVFKDGSISPVFHIPGRAPDTNITGTNPFITSFSNWDTDNIPSDTNVFNTNKTKRWQVYNTATKYGTPFSGSDVSGLMGYYETPTTYPDVDAPCDNHADGYWGRDSNNNLIVPGVTKIRHHRMPASELYPTGSSAGTSDFRTGIKFTINVDYPDPDIVGHYFVHGDRTYEKTIVDKGLLITTKYDSDPGIHTLYAMWLEPKNGDTDLLDNVFAGNVASRTAYQFISPKITLEETYSLGTYIRLDKYTTGTFYFKGSLTPTAERYDKVINCINTAVTVAEDYNVYSHFNYKIDWASFLRKSILDSPANSVVIPSTGTPIENLSFHNNWLILDLEEVIAPYVSGSFSDGELPIVSIKADTDVFTNLATIDYRRIGNAITTKTNGIQSNLTTYTGDTFVTKFTAVDYAYGRNGSGDVYVIGDAVQVPVESEYAYEFRHGDSNTQGQDTYFKLNPTDPEPYIPFVEYIADKYNEPVPDESSYFYPEKYLLNKSFSNLDSINRYSPLPYDYEFCNDCLENFPHRIYYSELDDQEQSVDNFRIIRPLNYQDLSGTTGEINDLFNNFSKLYAITDLSPYYIPTRPQQLTTDSSSIYIGTSEVFSIPPSQLKVTDYHFGGSRLFKSRVSTEYGTFYIDDFNGKPFFIDNQLEDLSLKGMRNFWQENGKLEFDKQFYQKTGEHYPNLSTSSETGIGYITTYDPRFKRIIIHKKDYKFYANYKVFYQVDTPTEESIWFDGRWFYYVNSDLETTLITLEDSTFFENKSFTISYSFITKSWVSFHSYLPYYLFNNYLSYYSNTFSDNFIYTHLEGNHTEYYNEYYPHIIDLIAVNNPNEESQYTNLIYSSSSQILDVATNQFKNVPITFNKAVFYNSKQSTGLKDLTLKQGYYDFDYDSSTVLLDKVDGKYKASGFRDIIISEDESIWNSSWQLLQSSPFNYIDKIPNTLNLELLNPSLFESPRFRDYYLEIRLIHNPTQNIKINTDIINTRSSNRTR